MMRELLILALVTATALGQQPAEGAQQSGVLPGTASRQHPQAVTYADLYCAGFVSRAHISMSNRIVGGGGSPESAMFAGEDYVFVDGSGLQENTRYAVIRQLRNPNRTEQFAGQSGLQSHAGQPYADIAHIIVKAIRGPVAVASIEYSCQAITPGDLVVPFQERPLVGVPSDTVFEQFPELSNKLRGRILLANEYDTNVGTGQKVYLTVGENKGVKPGDRFRVLRRYSPDQLDETDRLSYKTPAPEDTQKHPIKYTSGLTREFPPKAIAELVILTVSPASAAGMITFALEPVHVGDHVELIP